MKTYPVAPDRCPCCGHLLSQWTADAIVNAFHDWVAKHGKPPSRRDWARAAPEHPADITVRLVFGSWSRGRAIAGYPVVSRPGRHPQWTRELVVAAILDELFRTGRWPTAASWSQPANGRQRPSYETVRHLFGGMAIARRAAQGASAEVAP